MLQIHSIKNCPVDSDHTWGTNILKEKYKSKIACSKECAKQLSIPINLFNLMYFEDSSYFSVENIDCIIDNNDYLLWNSYKFKFIDSPGHSKSSICIVIDDNIFTGDTIMYEYKPHIKKNLNGSWSDFKITLNSLFNTIPLDTKVFPGHGEQFKLGDVYEFYKEYM